MADRPLQLLPDQLATDRGLIRRYTRRSSAFGLRAQALTKVRA
jgi:hypothetical protein